MWRQLYFILPLLLSVTSIRVPVDNVETSTTVTVTEVQGTQNTPIYYITDDAHVDSYLTSPDPQKPSETTAGINSPATFLVPPAKDKQVDYYLPSERNIQSDWLPMVEIQPENTRKVRYQRLPHQSIPIIFNPGPEGVLPIPSTHLEPPAVDAINEFYLPVAEETENEATEGLSINKPVAPEEPTLPLHLTPPLQKSMNAPTKLYPKKFHLVRPIPIPVSHTQYAEEVPEIAPKVQPAKYFKAPPSAEIEQIPNGDKNLYLYKKAEHQRKLKEEEMAKQHQLADAAAEETYGEPTSDEQETSETNLRYPGRNVYAAPVRQAPPLSPPRDAGPAAPAPDGRTEFRMHGMKGPHSYQFGYDTGKGKNRQFRFEERDNDGIVKGHYGYVDRSGKLRVVNYSAHPEYGFRAEEPVAAQP